MKHFKIIIALLFITPFVWGQNCISGDCENGIGTKKSKFTSYTGSFKEGFMHGKGVYKWKSGGSYEGEFRENYFEGHGIRIYKDGAKYEGGYKYNKRHGKGKITYSSGNTYMGDWQFNYKHGRGLSINKDGYSYTGLMRFDKKEGKGKQKWKNGDVFIGSFKEDLREGYGEYTWPTGSTYKGNWKSGEKHGIGISKNKFDEIINKGLWFEGKHKSTKTGCLEKNSCLDERWCCLVAQKEREIYFGNNQKFLLDKNQLTNFLENSPNAKKRYFYDSKWNLTSANKAKYFREYSNLDTLTMTYSLKAFYTSNNQLQWSGKVRNNRPSDTSCSSALCEGNVIWYKESSRLSSESSFLEGRSHGKFIFYFKNGKTSITNYDRGKRIKK
tara:strand:+ start:1799 stop:2950 length:1152 start_codon:yes stop_codon:yes gene_type:complete